ncbi:MAG: MarR family transcriptional regulator [Negativicutes bacterium]|nr:MarR family transcriptional regulator [Negativicutes bacterium]
MDIQKDTAESSSALKLFVVLVKAYQAIQEIDYRDIRGYGFNPTEFAVLDLLYHKGPHPLQQIGGKILITSGSITYVIDKLEKKGLIIRQPCEKDRRVIYAVLTASGQETMKLIFPRHAEVLCKALAGLSPEEQEAATQLLKKMGLYAQQLE